ncbi:TPA: hypothetical protein U2Q76_000360 [Acinetobacter baumannii]|nr:hypothetical protein [Acinetobacter baumannii]
MGTVIRLKNVSIGSSPLGMVHDENYSLPNGKMLFQPKTNLANSQDILGTAIVTEVGTPIYSSGYVQGKGTTSYLKTNFVRDSAKSFSLCIVGKRDATDGLQLFAGDYHNNTDPARPYDTGCGIFGAGPHGLRPTLISTIGNIFSSNIPAALTNITISEWHFACLTVDVVNKLATFYVPELNLTWPVSFSSTPLKPLVAGEYFYIAGSSGLTVGADPFTSYTSFHERVFTAEEVTRQYQNAKQYCATKGITVK